MIRDAFRNRFAVGDDAYVPRICVVNVLCGLALGCFRLRQGTDRICVHDRKNPGCVMQPGYDCRLRELGVMGAWIVDTQRTRWPSNGVGRYLEDLLTTSQSSPSPSLGAPPPRTALEVPTSNGPTAFSSPHHCHRGERCRPHHSFERDCHHLARPHRRMLPQIAWHRTHDFQKPRQQHQSSL